MRVRVMYLCGFVCVLMVRLSLLRGEKKEWAEGEGDTERQRQRQTDITDRLNYVTKRR